MGGGAFLRNTFGTICFIRFPAMRFPPQALHQYTINPVKHALSAESEYGNRKLTEGRAMTRFCLTLCVSFCTIDERQMIAAYRVMRQALAGELL